MYIVYLIDSENSVCVLGVYHNLGEAMERHHKFVNNYLGDYKIISVKRVNNNEDYNCTDWLI